MRLHRKPVLQIAALIVASMLLLALFGILGTPDGASNDALQSPVWTDMPGTSPFVSPVLPDSSLLPGAQPSAFSPTRPPAFFPRLFAVTFWSSPMPWIAVGIVFFGGLAQALTALFRRFEFE